MADYKKLYHDLFNGLTRLLEEIQELQQDAEETFIETSEDDESDE